MASYTTTFDIRSENETREREKRESNVYTNISRKETSDDDHIHPFSEWIFY